MHRAAPLGEKKNEEREPSERWAWRSARVETSESRPARAPGAAAKEAHRRGKGSYSNLFPSLARAGPTRTFWCEEGSDPHPHPFQPWVSNLHHTHTFQAGRSKVNHNCSEQNLGLWEDQKSRPWGSHLLWELDPPRKNLLQSNSGPERSYLTPSTSVFSPPQGPKAIKASTHRSTQEMSSPFLSRCTTVACPSGSVRLRSCEFLSTLAILKSRLDKSRTYVPQ